MQTQARVVVIGGGVVGVSTLYHLAKKGWSDVVLLERTELTAGSTWHAAGLLPLFNMSYTVGQLHKYSVDLYKTLEEETGQAVGFHVTGNLRLATNRERMDEYQKYCGTANTIGVPFELITPAEIKELWPLCEVEGLVGALYHPDDGHIAPVDLTQALAAGARNMGATIHRHTIVTDIVQKANGEWLVSTDQGEITCEHVVSCTGNYGRQTLEMIGLQIPMIPVEHQYIVTDEVPELVERHQAGLPEMAVLRESDASYYLREERQGYILGPYEKGAPACFVDGVPDTFGQDLFPGDLDRLMPHVEAAMKRVPTFEKAGIKDIINGPIAYTPDGSPLVGPAWDRRNFWMSEGHSFGVTAAGGAGWQLAEWIVEGEPGIDMMDVDPRRFGPYANKNYARLKNEECYEHVFIIHYPDEERPAARPLKVSPCHERLAAAGAVFGQRYGWERPNWFAPPGVEGKDVWSFRRSNYFEHVGNECRAVRERVGIIDITSFSKFAVSGPGAEGFLDGLVARKLPKGIGRINLSHALTPKGTVRTEFTIMRDGPEQFYLVSSGAAERYDGDLLRKRLPADGSVRIDNLTTSHGVLVLVGPKAREVLAKVTDADLSNQAFPWLTGQWINVGNAPARAMRLNFVGELGWELHHPIEYQNHIFDALIEAGAEFDLGHCGMRAMESLRIEKSYRMWGLDLSRDYSVLEAGMGRFVHLDKGAFTGREALLRQQEAGIPTTFSTLEVDADDADPGGDEPIFLDGEMVGRATSGSYGHFLGKSLALGYLRTDVAVPGTRMQINILGDLRDAVVVEESPHDPENLRLRA
ncbi:MAG: FAD-dependent oxidoreductase [Alphaproteobacteria bacterium]|jgi:dimethylglycine dehydrogenase|nr:FAD-dependent oxidoreductase [Alphaproteobacteria bacterium]MDP6565812.1 FAD-dependent oxidoreductase [Alphaproteobacteria bacterium]MDP6816073.1 FAD-dependent oxidoreductase [Alphaproteobacteria bacterium]